MVWLNIIISTLKLVLSAPVKNTTNYDEVFYTAMITVDRRKNINLISRTSYQLSIVSSVETVQFLLIFRAFLYVYG